MALAVYPANINYMPDMSSFRVVEPYAPPIWSEFEDGPDLGRRSRIGRRAKMSYRIMFRTPEEFDIFKEFVEVTLADGTMRFTMPVYIPKLKAYMSKTVQLDKGMYSADPFGLGFSVSFTLNVHNW